jgi:NYN domain
MHKNPLCSIAVFHDGSYVHTAQHYYHAVEQRGWMELGRLHELIVGQVRQHEGAYERHAITYAAWFQCFSDVGSVTPDQRTNDRMLLSDLSRYGVEPSLWPMGPNGEKCVDVALALSAQELALTGRIDFIALVTGDRDFLPLVASIKRRGVRVGVFGFVFEEAASGRKYKSAIAPALMDAAHLGVDVADLVRTHADVRRDLFRPATERGYDASGERDQRGSSPRGARKSGPASTR